MNITEHHRRTRHTGSRIRHVGQSSLAGLRLLSLGAACWSAASLAAVVWAQAPAAAPTAASATSASSTASAPALKEALPQAQLQGQTRLTVWGFQIYDARLWTLPGFVAPQYAAQPLALELSYLRAFEAADIAERSLQEMRRSARIDEAQAQRWSAEMRRVFPDVKKGDRLLGLHRPGEGATFWLNGQRRGEIADAEFSRLFFGIWLSPQTSEPAMRAALLRGAGS